MNILAIDTTNEYLSLALNKANHRYELQLRVGTKQSELILPKIDELFSTAQLDLNEINGIAYNMGPGSFTGLRICLSIAKALGYSLQQKLYPIPAFLLYAEQIQEQNKARYCLVTLDARLEQIYVALIDCEDYTFARQPELINPEDLSQYLKNYPSTADITVTGNGWLSYQEKFSHELLRQLEYIDSGYPSPNTMLTILKKNILKPVCAKAADLLYLRNKVALNLDEQKQNKNL